VRGRNFSFKRNSSYSIIQSKGENKKWQRTRIAKANNMSEEKVRAIIEKCTDSRFLGVFGEKTVNVLKVNLMLDGIL
jgi:K+-transporting ATPase c subunit